MKSILMSLALVGAFTAMSAKGDSYLYWMVDQDIDSAFKFDTAVLSAYKDSSRSDQVWFGSVAGDALPVLSLDSVRSVSQLPIELGNGKDWTFLVELYADSKWVAESTLSYLALANAIYTPPIPDHGAVVAQFTTFSVPEPTSGLLVLLGMCGLALKRKRA